MMDGRLSCQVFTDRIPVLPGAVHCAEEFLLTAAAQRNRNHLGQYVRFEKIPFAMEEVLFDPQTSGGLLVAVGPDEAQPLLADLRAEGLDAAIVGRICGKEDTEIHVI
jgi:selenide,water dikinase